MEAGTVLTIEQSKRAIDAGTGFIVMNFIKL